MNDVMDVVRPGLPWLQGPVPGPRALEVIARDREHV